MRLILTHEQSDFDALASLLGAYLLYNSNIPVLPRKLNRNVRSFMTIYGVDLPFVDARDLPKGKIESVTLVDTQSLITIKGMDNNTIVRVIDHHPLRSGIPSSWIVTLTETGSTTTFLTELISDEYNSLPVVYATLLLMGIYEDTGSLTYINTTGRDGRAAGYLLDIGANLQIVEKFLNPPLTTEQREFYDYLSANARIHDINGHRIVITCGDMEEFNDEISTLAHKLRDYFDPDGLFVIVKTNEGIRLVARSSSDDIDVGAIAVHFGGGGHDRAAAALIRSSELKQNQIETEAIYLMLIDILPKHVQPSITVSQIMSGRPHVLSPETSVTEASRLMQLYGYEGYPVVDNGKVIGLLTRRVVDKALNHNLKLTAELLMDANDVWVGPDDSIHHLQTRMTDSGWGQIPVVDPKSGEMIGIVTRTDLLKMLSPKESNKIRDNYESHLIRALPPNRLLILRSIAAEADKQKIPIYIVGGFVRDLILERPSIDFDIVVEGDAILMAKNVASIYGGRITVHNRFGTAKWYLEDSKFDEKDLPAFIDFITARLEFYPHPTALPTVERSSIKFDLHRRDFSINTLALRLDGKHFGELNDYWGGRSDLKDHIIRVLHSLSFVDDPTPMIRAIRFEKRFDFNIEDRTLHLMLDAKSLLNNLSGDRVRHEINLILEEEKCAQILARLADLELLKEIHPSLPWNDEIYKEISENIQQGLPADWDLPAKIKISSGRMNLGYLLWLSNVDEQDVDNVCSRLKLSETLRRTIHAIKTIMRILPELIDSPPSEINKHLDDLPLMALLVARMKIDPIEAKLIEKYILIWKNLSPKINGDDLLKLGLQPGPIFHEILERLQTAWLDGDISTAEEETDLLNEIIISGDKNAAKN